MIGLRQKPTEKILEYLDGKENIVIMGCGGCATIFHAGGESEVEEMADTLSRQGKNILAAIPAPLGQFTCYAPWSRERLEHHRREIEHCEAMLMMTCGCGLQVVQEILSKDYDIIIPIYPATDAIGDLGGGPSLFQEKCHQCGDCLLADFAGICPFTLCPKGLLNGPCGGAKFDKCELDSKLDCIWLSIYERLKRLGELDKLKGLVAPKNYSKMNRPRSVELTPLPIK